MRMLIVVALALLPTAALTGDQMSVSEQASRCWNIPPNVSDDFRADFDVILGGDGAVKDIAVVTYTPESAASKAAVLRASRAIEMCGPYNTAETGMVKVTIPSDQARAPIDPFKPLKPE